MDALSIAHVRASVPLGVLQVITTEQVARLEILVGGFNADRFVLTQDSWQTTNICFALYGPKDEIIINGLIEPDGSAHT